jgi:hypothetical protein
MRSKEKGRKEEEVCHKAKVSDEGVLCDEEKVKRRSAKRRHEMSASSNIR